MLELQAVTKSYGIGAHSVHALKGIDLSVARGQFVSVMGPSGSGKSTLLNIVSALDVPSSGRICVDGKDISALDDDALTLFRRRHIGLVFQFFNLLPTLSALENVLLPVNLDRRATCEDHTRARKLLEELNLGSRLSHSPHQLSGGEMQRVAIARALIMRPALILADEPTGNLDSVTGAAILSLLRETCKLTGTTLIMVTHDAQAAKVGDRVLHLKDGLLAHDLRTEAAAE